MGVIIQCMKSRSSTGVGMKIDLDYNIETMRITDSGEEQNNFSGSSGPKASDIMGQIKGRSNVNDPVISDSQPKLDTGIQSNKLKQMLSGLKSTNQV